MTNLPPLPPFYHPAHSTGWDGPGYYTNAVEDDDPASNRLALSADLREATLSTYGTFWVVRASFPKGSGVLHCGWMCREGAQQALWYACKTTANSLQNALSAAIDQQAELYRMRGLPVLKTPTIKDLKK